MRLAEKILKSEKLRRLSWKEAAALLREGAVGVMPTDTLYGICASAFNKGAVREVYRLRKRNPQKPMVILIGSMRDLKKFNVTLKPWQKNILKRLWPGKISAVLPCLEKKFSYLHRGTRTLAFRLPKKRELIHILSISGPLIAPSANWEGRAPAVTALQAKRYFGKNVFYCGRGRMAGKPSTLIDLTRKTHILKVLRIGAEYHSIRRIRSL